MSRLLCHQDDDCLLHLLPALLPLAAPSMDLGASLGRRARLWLPTCQEAGVQSMGRPGATMVSGL